MKVNTTLKIVGIVLVASLAITTAVYFVGDWHEPMKGEWKSGIVGGYDSEGRYLMLNSGEPVVLSVKSTKNGLFSGTLDGDDVCGTISGSEVFFMNAVADRKTTFFGKLDDGVLRGAISTVWKDGAICYAAEFSKKGGAFPEPVPTVQNLKFDAVDGQYLNADSKFAKDLMGYGKQYTGILQQTGRSVYGFMDIVSSGKVRSAPIVGTIVSYDLDFTNIYVVNSAGTAGMYKIYKNSAVFFTGIVMSDIEGPQLKRAVFDRYYVASGQTGIAVVWQDFSGTEWKCVSESYMSSKTPGSYSSRVDSIKFAPTQTASMIRGVLKVGDVELDMAFSMAYMDGIRLSTITESENNLYGTFNSTGTVLTIYGAWHDTDMHSVKYVFEKV